MDPYLFWPMALIGFCTMIYGSYTDHRKRSVNFLLFIPLIAVTTLVMILQGQWIFVILSVILFLSLFLDSSEMLHFFAVAAISVIGVLVLLTYSSFELLLSWIFMIIFAFMGFREILFGKGDIKAAVSIIYSMALLSVYAGHLISIPLPFLFFLNLGIASSLAFSWAMFYIWKVTGKFGFAVKFSGKVDEVKFRTMGENGNIVAYNIPFLIAISIAYFITMASYLTGSVA